MKKSFLFIAFCCAIVFAVACGNSSSSNSSYDDAQSSYTLYTQFGQALSDGSVRYGMTYGEIQEVCGPADEVVRLDGHVSKVRYGSHGTVYTLDFRDGRFFSYLESQWNF